MSGQSDREFENQGNNPTSGRSGQGQQAGGYGKGAGSEMDDDEVTTSGGREGNFSDKNRDTEDKWSPGSSQPPGQ